MTVLETSRKQEVDEAIRIFQAFSRDHQRDLVIFLRGVAFGYRSHDARAVGDDRERRDSDA